MILSIFYSLLFTLLPDPQTPNFYSGLMSAKEASKKTQKEMVIFFTDKSCTTCEAAWVAYTKDAVSTSQYISTRMSRSDFDGGIFFDLLELEETPSWVILAPDGTEKERWTGGWKDASGNPTMFDMTVQKTEVKEPKTIISTPAPSPATTVVSKNNSPATSKPASTPSSPTITSGYFIQAGYFGSEANAQKLVIDLNSKGHTGFQIRVEEKDGKVFYRVMKNFPDESSAKVEQGKMDSTGIATSIKSN